MLIANCFFYFNYIIIKGAKLWEIYLKTVILATGTYLKGKIFRHFKGDLYLVEDFVKHSETQETMVLYRALYGDCGLFVRPYDMFVEEVPEGKTNPTGQKYRFQEFEVKSVK